MDVDTEFRKILAGTEVTPERQMLNAIIKAYDMTRDESGARIPTLLMATIEMARGG